MAAEHIVAIATLCGVVFSAIMATLAAYFQAKAKKDLAEVNDAVNHRVEKHGDNALKLYDLVWENHERNNELIEWKRGYDGGPLDKGDKVVAFVEATEKKFEQHQENFDKLLELIGDLACPWLKEAYGGDDVDLKELLKKKATERLLARRQVQESIEGGKCPLREKTNCPLRPGEPQHEDCPLKTEESEGDGKPDDE